MKQHINVILLFLCILTTFGCKTDKTDIYLKYALYAAGKNRGQLERVLDYYSNDSLKYKAACFLIENMPGHYSYAQKDRINAYYNDAKKILLTPSLTPKQQRDSILVISDSLYALLDKITVEDVKVVKADFLIHNIDRAFEVWQGNPRCKHVDFATFCEMILPYKCVELQEMDSWRDTLSARFSEDLLAYPYNDENWDSPYRTVNLIRDEMLRKIKPVGMFNRSGHALLRADLLPIQTYGRCEDYVNLAVLTFRSMGIPVVIDVAPYWGRYRAGHSWYTLLNDRGEELSAEWDIGSLPGTAFFPYQRIPKVYRNTYAINREIAKYRINSIYKFPFELCQLDVTDKYVKTDNISIPIEKCKLAEDYVYISTFTGRPQDWSVIDYGMIHKGRAQFNKIGRNVLYIVHGFDGEKLIPVTKPFIIHKNGDIEYITSDKEQESMLTLYRKYPESENVVSMRRRILGAQIQASNNKDFSKYDVLYTVTSTNIPDKIKLDCSKSYRYYRYMSADGTYGSVAELKFWMNDTVPVTGSYMACPSASNDAIGKAFDDDWLTNFETDNQDGAWIGIDAKKPVVASHVRIVPRGDDNDIHPGDEYELLYWDNEYGWTSLGVKFAQGNSLTYKHVPEDALLWLRNYTRGWDERPFRVINNAIEWW